MVIANQSNAPLMEKNTPFFSYIIPIYNAERYIQRCLSSIQGQSFRDFEAIMVDDGSTDGGSEIAKSFAESDSRFKYYRQENQGSSVAYNRGIDLATGLYLVFLDNDDWNSPDTLKETHQAIEKDPSFDIVQFSMIKEYEDDRPTGEKQYVTPLMLNGPDDIRIAAKNEQINTLTHSGKAIRRTLFNGQDPIRFDGFAKGADLFLIRKLLCLAQRVSVVPSAEWHFYIRPSSQSHSKTDPALLSQYSLYGVHTVLSDVAFYELHYDKEHTRPIWQLDNLAWDSFLAYCRSKKANGSFKRREASKIAKQIWRKRHQILSNKKRRFSAWCMMLFPSLFLALHR